MNERILVVEDEKELAELLSLYLRAEGYEITVCHTGMQARASIGEKEPDMAILDVMLPEDDGFSLCRRLRQTSFCPVMFLTARTADADKILGLNLGADDYVTKPFSPMEVMARVKSLLRRYHHYNSGLAQSQPVKEYDIRGLRISRISHRCELYGKTLALTPLEFDILWHLCEHQGQVVSSEALFEAVWKEKFLDSNNTVMGHIARLREKMGEPPRAPRFIKTVWGVGYTIESR